MCPGFTGGAQDAAINAEIAQYLDNGFHYMSVGYRLVATKYLWGAAGTEEEFIHVDRTGKLALDTTGKVLSSYKVHVGRTEFNTKCSYDAAQALEHLITHADQLQVDVHKISMTGGSAGGGEIHYLTWVYHALPGNFARYTPVSMVYNMAQLDYPVQNMLDKVWGLWADDVGASTKLSTILSYTDCAMIIGNPWCDPSGNGPEHATDPPLVLCNMTWQKESLARYCSSEAVFERATIGDCKATQVLPVLTEQDRGLEMLWYNSDNMQKHQPKPDGTSARSFFLYIANPLNSTAGMNVVRNALYSRNYAKYAELAGISYTTYYTDYHGMTEDDKGQQRFVTSGGRGAMTWNYRSNFGWAESAGVGTKLQAAASTEQLMFVCHAMNMTCTSGALPQPGGGLTPACKELVRKDCGIVAPAGCRKCIPQHVEELLAAGCPRMGPASCDAYCETLGGGGH